MDKKIKCVLGNNIQCILGNNILDNMQCILGKIYNVY